MMWIIASVIFGGIQMKSYKVRLSATGRHYAELLGGWLCIILITLSLAAIAYGIMDKADNENLSVGHVYEDGCIDLYNSDTNNYMFMCESEFE